MNKVQLNRRLFNPRMTDDTRVVKHLSEFHKIITQLSAVDVDFEDDR